MSYRNCPHCKASNRRQDLNCYSCGNGMESVSEVTAEESIETAQDLSAAVAETAKSTTMSFVAVALSTFLGGGMGFALQELELEMPFFLAEILMGVVCALATAFNLAKFQEMPEGLMHKRLGPAAAFGALVGFCLYSVWWTFDPSAGLPAVGMIAGFCAGLPIVVSFGLAGGESRPLGSLEFLNVGASFLLGLVLALVFAIEDGDFYLMPGLAGIFGLIPTLVGGRVNLYEFFRDLERF